MSAKQKANLQKSRNNDPQPDDSCKDDFRNALPPWLGLVWEKFARFAEGFHCVAATCLGKISNGLGLSKLSSWVNRRLSKRPSVLFMELFVAVALSVSFFLLVKPWTAPLPNGDKRHTFLFFYLSKHISPETHKSVMVQWRKRLLAPAVTAWLTDTFYNWKPKGEIGLDESFQKIFCGYYAGWLFLLYVMLILYRKDALFIMLGVFAGLVYNLTDTDEWPMYFPWDIPNMFFFTAAWLFYDSKRIWPLVVTVWIGSLVKETNLLCAMLILVGPHWSWRTRIAGFLSAVAAYFITSKMLMTHFGVTGPTILIAMNGATNYYDLLVQTWIGRIPNNVSRIFSLELRHVSFANAGAILLIMFIPWRNYRDVVLKLMAVIFILGQFCYGWFTEVRIWYEILPMGWMMISEFLSREGVQNQAASNSNLRKFRVLRGSYGLMIVSLLMLIFGAKYYFSDMRMVGRLQSKAAKGDAQAQYELAKHYKAGESVTANPTNAFQWFFKAAKQGVADAQYQVAMDCLQGNGTTKDILASIPWFRKAADQGTADAQCQLGIRYTLGEGVERDPATACLWFRKAAAQTNADAEFNLGMLYEHGLGVTQDLAEAAIWYQRAGDNGSVPADNSLGMICVNSRKDYVEAAKWFGKAADQGNALSQNSLGVLYLQGLGVKQDANEAFKWFQQSAQEGLADGQNNCALVLFGAQRFNEAAQWFHRAADQGYAAAQFNLAQFYQRGLVYPQDLGEAFLWYSRAANQGYGLAQLALGKIYREGQGVKADKVEAYKWFKLAQLQGIQDAQGEITNCAAAMSKDELTNAENEVKQALNGGH